VAALPHDATVAGGQGTAPGACGPEGCFDERPAEPDVAFARLRRLMLAGTLVVAGTEARPAGEMAIAGEPGHVHADLCDEHFGRPLVDAGDGIEPFHETGSTPNNSLGVRSGGQTC